MRKITNSKYMPRYAKWLRNGLRKDGKYIPEICAEWGIREKTYWNWVKTQPVFEDAHEVGEIDFKCFWARHFRDTATGDSSGNPGMLQLAAKNYLGMVDKQEVAHTHEEQITTIRIERIESPKIRVIEH